MQRRQLLTSAAAVAVSAISLPSYAHSTRRSTPRAR